MRIQKINGNKLIALKNYILKFSLKLIYLIYKQTYNLTRDFTLKWFTLFFYYSKWHLKINFILQLEFETVLGYFICETC